MLWFLFTTATSFIHISLRITEQFEDELLELMFNDNREAFWHIAKMMALYRRIKKTTFCNHPDLYLYAQLLKLCFNSIL